MKQQIRALYQDKELAEQLVRLIQEYDGRALKIMEVCGTHTMAISRFGIRSILPKQIRLISGPGCPVCVTPSAYFKAALQLAKDPEVILTTFGDLLRVPYQGKSLLSEKARGSEIRMVYSPLDNVAIAKANPEKKVIFLAVGFETTHPVIALSVLEALKAGVTNYLLLTANKTIPEAMRRLATDPELKIDGYIYPGHVSAIIGTSFYQELAEQYGIPGVVAGFEPVDLLGAIYQLLRQTEHNQPKVENLYARVVNPAGNKLALAKTYQIFEECDAIWRGIGLIPKSGLKLKEKYRELDAWRLVDFANDEVAKEPAGCSCGDILTGKSLPHECPLFGKACTPENPVGACMVSSEGSCAAYYQYAEVLL